MRWIGIDIGGTNIKYGLVDQEGQVTQNSQIDTPKTHGNLVEYLGRIISTFQKNQHIQGVGISAPGVILTDGTMITAGALYDSYGKNLVKDLHTKFSLPVYVENDANAATIAEQWIGNAQQKKNYLCIVIGTGIGGGIVVDGEIFRGTHGMAGEFGWMMIDQLPKEGNLEVSSLNQRASVIGGICEKYNQLSGSSIREAQIIFEKYKLGDPKAHQVLNDFYQSLSVGILNLISCFDPEIVLIGGAISENGEFINTLQMKLKEMIIRHEAITAALKNIDISVTAVKLRNNAGLIGAVYQLRKSLTLESGKKDKASFIMN